ncbi:TraG family conjugative transposon ATPase (plasmid) [Hymenobacter sp. NBH84]|uniref:TraG family conjugative transposon ATPase n=1 Tax=Hymenobacter sp. NBH84 TaxID=2596915 RepID=UPI001623DA80|nr:TraG family conjugative transposon ATPase [Hymenobacter sp. NBH84]QNE42231.1 TraG family conjugative transposon ATPase [Hymenobacter sp. NBH84]
MSQLLQPAATLEQKQPIYKVEQGCLISKNGDVTVAFRLELPEIYTLAQHEYESLHSAFVKAVRLLPNHTVVHKQDWFVEDKYTASFEEERSMLSHAYERNFNERPFLNHYCYLYLTKTPSSRENWTSLSTLLSRSKIVPKEMMDEKLLSAFFNAVGQFVRVLSDAGIGFAQLTDDELTGTDEKTGLLEKYLSLNMSDVAPMTDLDFTSGLKVGNKICQCYSLGNLDDLPVALSTSARHSNLSTDYTNFFVGFTSPVGLSLNCNHIYNQYLFVDDAAKTLKNFEKKRDNLNALSLYSRQNAINKEFYDRYLNEAHSEQKLPVRAHANVFTWTEREADLKGIREQTGGAITLMGCKARENTVDIGGLFWAGIPGNAGDFPSEETFYTFAEPACCLWSVETNYRSSSSPFGIKLSDRITGKPVHVDISDEPRTKGIIANRNKFVLGGSGSGKSFFTNGMVRQYHEQGSHVLIVDTGNSYKGLCELRNGVYFTYEEKKPISFNPFYVVGSPDVEKRLSLHNLLVMLWKRENEDVTQSEYVSISSALTQYYQWLAVTPSALASFNTFYEFLQGPFKEYLATEKVREQDFDMQNFLYVLKPYYRGGEYDYLLNSAQQLDLTRESFIVFEIDNIKDHPILFPVVTLVIMDTFLQKMRTLEGVRKMILIEEAWKAIATPAMAEYLKYLFKTVRKFQGEAVVVTQEVKDILDNPVVKDTIITQSDCMILLDLRKFMGRFDEIQEVLALSEKQKALVLSINQDRRQNVRYNEVYIGLGTTVATVYGVEVSKEEYVTYTTEQAEKVVLFNKVKAGMKIESAIQAYAQELREAG